MLCSFLNSREAWVEIPSDRFRDIVSLATSGSDVADPDWQVARAHLVLHLIFAAPLVPPRGATLVNTGTDRKSVVTGKSVSVRVDPGGRWIIKKKKKNNYK